MTSTKRLLKPKMLQNQRCKRRRLLQPLLLPLQLQLNKRTTIDEVAIEVLDEADEEVTDHVVHHEHKTVKTPKVLHNEKEVTDQEVVDVDAAEEDDVMVTESLIENLVIQRAHTRDLINVKVLVLETGVLLKMI